MQLEVAPAVADEVALGVGAIEAEENERLLHHLLGLERDGKLRILKRDIIWGVRRPWGIRRRREDDRRLRFLV